MSSSILRNWRVQKYMEDHPEGISPFVTRHDTMGQHSKGSTAAREHSARNTNQDNGAVRPPASARTHYSAHAPARKETSALRPIQRVGQASRGRPTSAFVSSFKRGKWDPVEGTFDLTKEVPKSEKIRQSDEEDFSEIDIVLDSTSNYSPKPSPSTSGRTERPEHRNARNDRTDTISRLNQNRKEAPVIRQEAVASAVERKRRADSFQDANNEKRRRLEELSSKHTDRKRPLQANKVVEISSDDSDTQTMTRTQTTPISNGRSQTTQDSSARRPFKREEKIAALNDSGTRGTSAARDRIEQLQERNGELVQPQRDDREKIAMSKAFAGRSAVVKSQSSTKVTNGPAERQIKPQVGTPGTTNREKLQKLRDRSNPRKPMAAFDAAMKGRESSAESSEYDSDPFDDLDARKANTFHDTAESSAESYTPKKTTMSDLQTPVSHAKPTTANIPASGLFVEDDSSSNDGSRAEDMVIPSIEDDVNMADMTEPDGSDGTSDEDEDSAYDVNDDKTASREVRGSDMGLTRSIDSGSGDRHDTPLQVAKSPSPTDELFIDGGASSVADEPMECAIDEDSGHGNGTGLDPMNKPSVVLDDLSPERHVTSRAKDHPQSHPANPIIAKESTLLEKLKSSNYSTKKLEKDRAHSKAQINLKNVLKKNTKIASRKVGWYEEMDEDGPMETAPDTNSVNIMAPIKPVLSEEVIEAHAKAGADRNIQGKATKLGFEFSKPLVATETYDTTAPDYGKKHKDSDSTNDDIPAWDSEKLSRAASGPISMKELLSNTRGGYKPKQNKPKQNKTSTPKKTAASKRPGYVYKSKLTDVKGIDADGNLIDRDEFIVLNGNQGWDCRTIARQLRERFEIILKGSEVRAIYDQVEGTKNGLVLDHGASKRRRTSTSGKREVSVHRGAAPNDQQDIMLGESDPDEDDDEDAPQEEQRSDPMTALNTAEQAIQNETQSSLLPIQCKTGLPVHSKPERQHGKANKPKTKLKSIAETKKAVVTPITVPRPTEGGKTISPWLRKYHDELFVPGLVDDDSMIDEDEEVKDKEDAQNNTYFIYNIHLRESEINDDDDDDEDDGPIVGTDHTTLSQANHEAMLIAIGSSLPISASLTWAFDPNGMVTYKLTRGTLVSRARVKRSVRTCKPDEPKLDASINLFDRRVYVVKEEISVQVDSRSRSLTRDASFTSPVSNNEDDNEDTKTAAVRWQVISTHDVGAIHATIDHANSTASNHLVAIVKEHPPRFRRLEDIDLWKAEQAEQIKNLSKFCDEANEAFSETKELHDRSVAGGVKVVRVWVQERAFVGPRN